MKLAAISIFQFSRMNRGRAAASLLSQRLQMSTTATTTTTATFHEQGAGGINGRLAQLIQDRDYDSVISFFESTATATATPEPAMQSTATLNFLIDAYFNRGRHRDAILAAKRLDSLALSPNAQTFTLLLKGLVGVDSTGTLALTVDELFQFMTQKYGIVPDWQSWRYRIEAFLHAKFFNSSASSLSSASASASASPAIIFYEQMRQALPGQSAHLFQVQTDLLVSAVSRRLWSFAEFMLAEMESCAQTALAGQDEQLFPAWERVCLTNGLFSDIGCTPVLRRLQQFSLRLLARNCPLASPLVSLSLHRDLLAFAGKQGRVCADLAVHSLALLLERDPRRGDVYRALAGLALVRTVPRDVEFYGSTAADGSSDGSAVAPGKEQHVTRLLATAERVKCAGEYLERLKAAINT